VTEGNLRRQPVFCDRPLDGFIEVDGICSVYPVQNWLKASWAADSGADPSSASVFKRAVGTIECGPPFPAYLEVSFVEVGDLTIDVKGLDQGFKERAFLLSLAIVGVRPAHFQPNFPIWGRAVSASLADMRLFQPSFGLPEEISLSDYRAFGGAATVYSGETSYLSSVAPYTENRILVPDYLGEFFSKYQQLSEKLKADFLRAAGLFSQANMMRRLGMDSLQTYVSAVEALFDKAKKKKCEKCGQDSYSLAARYRKFMDQFSQLEGASIFDYGSTYKLRSRIVHGDRVPKIDNSAWEEEYHPQQEWAVEALTRRALVNWLLESREKH
jgi:hypothetical protein